MLFLLLFSLPARAGGTEYDPVWFNSGTKADGHYETHEIGDHFEWTTYRQPYDVPDYGHVFEWSQPGLSAMSICEEKDAPTRGKRYLQPAEDGKCPAVEAGYRWDVPYAGQPSRCLKVDRATNGQRFSRIVDDKLCRKVETIFVWVKPPDGGKLDCHEVDARTEGNVYRRLAQPYFCAHTLDVDVAFGRDAPGLTRKNVRAARTPASVDSEEDKPEPAEFDPEFRENLSVHNK